MTLFVQFVIDYSILLGLLARRAFKEGKLSQDELKNIIASEKMLKCYIAYHQRLFFGDRSDKDMWLV